jgi:hypothetical protein
MEMKELERRLKARAREDLGREVDDAMHALKTLLFYDERTEIRGTGRNVKECLQSIESIIFGRHLADRERKLMDDFMKRVQALDITTGLTDVNGVTVRLCEECEARGWILNPEASSETCRVCNGRGCVPQ